MNAEKRPTSKEASGKKGPVANQTTRFYDPFLEHEPVKVDQRIKFLQAVRKRHHAVLQALLEKVFPTYNEIWTQNEACKTSTGLQAVTEQSERRWGKDVTFSKEANDISRWGMIQSANLEFRWFPEIVPLKQALVEWAFQFHLTADIDVAYPFMVTPMQCRVQQPMMVTSERLVAPEWILNVGLETMKSWASGSCDHSTLDWEYPTSFIFAPMFQQFQPAAWQPRNESRAAYLKRVEQCLNAEEELARKMGLEREEPTRKPRGDRQSAVPEDRAFEWFVLFQTAHASYSDIAERYPFPDPKTGHSNNYDDSSIGKAIRAAAKRVGLSPRK